MQDILTLKCYILQKAQQIENIAWWLLQNPNTQNNMSTLVTLCRNQNIWKQYHTAFMRGNEKWYSRRLYVTKPYIRYYLPLYHEGIFIIIFYCSICCFNYRMTVCTLRKTSESSNGVTVESFRNHTITDTITISEQPHVTSSLSVFVNAKPVESLFLKTCPISSVLYHNGENYWSLNSTKYIDMNLHDKHEKKAQ